jgi:hypothetical protein
LGNGRQKEHGNIVQKDLEPGSESRAVRQWIRAFREADDLVIAGVKRESKTGTFFFNQCQLIRSMDQGFSKRGGGGLGASIIARSAESTSYDHHVGTVCGEGQRGANVVHMVGYGLFPPNRGVHSAELVAQPLAIGVCDGSVEDFVTNCQDF